MYVRKIPLNPYDKVIRWNWYKAWTMVIFRPSTKTGEAFLQEGNISIRQVLIWNGVAAFIFGILFILEDVVTQPSLISSIKDVVEIILTLMVFAVGIELGILIYAIFINGLATRLKKKRPFINLYLLSGAIIPPVLILFGIIYLIDQFFSMTEIAIYLYLILGVYGSFILFPLPVRVVYRVNWLVSLLVTVVAPIMIMFACSLAYSLAIPSSE